MTDVEPDSVRDRAAGKPGRRAAGKLILRRGVAFLLDVALLFAILMPAGLLIQSLLGDPAESGPEIWRNILWNFSLPAWLYFALSDRSSRGATLGKRLMRLQVVSAGGDRAELGAAILRTAIKLIPWELAHLSAFALSQDLSEFSTLQATGIGLANALWITYVWILVANRGRRSVHDFAARTYVRNFA